ncbi:MAG TPA: SRPBCC family protein [Kineosporiaceae bacterium]
MTHQQALSVLASPLAVVEDAVRDVDRWPEFLLGLERVTRTSFGRYTFVVRDATTTREVAVAVTAHPAEHRFVWHALRGPRFDGEIRLAAVDASHTTVHLSLTADPAGFLAGLGELARISDTSTALLDLQRLEAFVTT